MIQPAMGGKFGIQCWSQIVIDVCVHSVEKMDKYFMQTIILYSILFTKQLYTQGSLLKN